MKAKVLMTGLFALALMAVGCKSNKENDPKENGTAKISIVVGGNTYAIGEIFQEDAIRHLDEIRKEHPKAYCHHL